MQNWFLGKIFNIVRFISANGPGKGGVTADEVASGAGSAIAKILTTIVEVLSNAVYWLWGLFMTAVYTIIKLLLNIVDVLQFFVMKLVGIDVYSNPNWKNVLTLRESDLIIKLITSDTVLNIFSKVAIISAVLLIIFCIFAIVKQNYTEAIGGESKGNAATKALKAMVKSIFLCFLVPFLLIVGILGSNVILASVCSAIKGNNNLTLGGVIFTASSYDANRYRLYARNGMRTPMYYTTATEIVNPSEYTSDDDMRVLFYQLVMGDVYIESLSEELQAELEKGTSSKYNFNIWYDTFKNFEVDGALDESTLEKVAGVAGTISKAFILANLAVFTGPLGLLGGIVLDQAIQGAGETVDDTDAYQGNEIMQAFETDFKAWYKENFNSVPLDDLYFANEHIKSIYKTNWTRNDALSNTSISFSATYREAGEYPFPSNPSKTVTIFANSDAYSIYEPFATYELEYYVMADFIDYAIEHNTKFYFINANNSIVKWNIEDEEEAINSYDAECEVYSYTDNEGVQYVIQRSSDTVKEVIEKDGKYLYRDTIEATKLSSDAFYVSYYNGVNKLYWSCDGSMSEKDGSTYIICFEKDGKMVPVTQKTTNFRSAFLASDYDGPIVARGVFAKCAMPGSTQYPTAIREQLVDEDGNAINTLEEMSTIGLSAYNVVNVKNEGGTETIVLSNTFKNFVDFGAEDNIPITDKSESSSLLASLTSKVKNDVIKTELSEVMSDLVVYDSNGCKKIRDLGISADNIYVNTAIAYYQIVGNNQIRFYDSLGRMMALTSSEEDKNSEYIQATNISDIYCYYAIGKDHIYRIYLDYNASTKDLVSHLNDLINNTDGYNSTVIDCSSLIFIRYCGKLVTMDVDGNSVSMIVGMVADGIMQQGMNEGALVKSGTFRTYEPVTTITNASFFANPVLKDGRILNSHTQIGIPQTNNAAYPTLVASTIDIYKEKFINLYIKHGEVYYTNGNLFLGKEDAVELFDNLKDSISNISTVEVANFLNNPNNPNAYYSSVIPITGYNEIKEQMQIILSADPFVIGSITESNIENLKLTENIGNYQYFYFDSNTKQIIDIIIINDENSETYTIRHNNTEVTNLSKDELYAKFIELNSEHILYCRYINSRYEDDGKVVYDPDNESINYINALEGALYYSGDDDYLYYRKKCAQDAFAYTANFLYGQDLIIGIGSAVQELPSAYYDIKVVEKTESDAGTTEKVNVSYYTSGGKQLKTVEAIKADQIHSEITKDLYVYYTQNGKKISNILVTTSPVSLTDYNEETISISISADFTRYKLLDDSYISLDLVTKIIGVDASNSQVPFTLKNGALYCNNKLVLTLDAIKNIAIQELNKNEYYKSTNFYTAGDTAGTYNDRYIYFEYGGFGINPFANVVVDLAFHIDVSSALNGKPIAIRFKINIVDAYETKVTYRLEGGGFLLNYNFRQDTGIGLSWLMDMKYINPLVLCLSTGIVFNMLWKMVWGLISRIYEIAIQFIILPGVLAVDVMSPGKFGDWSKNIIKKVMVAYSALIMINLYYALIPSISELTNGLIYWDQLPSTFTSWFSNINLGLSSIGGNIANNLQSFSSRTFGAIGMKLNSLLIMDDASKVAISGFLNKIIFILFFMVLTTLVAKGKDLIGDYINSGDIVKDGSGVFNDVKGLGEEYNKSIPGRVINGSVKAGGKALSLGAKGIASAVKSSRAGGDHEYTADDFTSESEGDGTDRATAVSTLGNTSATELASALTAFTPPINLVVNPTGSSRSTGRGVPITNTMPNGNEEEKHTESHGASVMNGSGGFGGGGDDGSASWAGKNHGSGTAYYGGGGSGGMSNAYVDDSYLVDNNMSISQMEEHLYGLADEMSKSKSEASKLMKESRATYTKQDAAEHAQVKTDLANLDDALIDSIREKNNIDPAKDPAALNSVNDMIRQINQESAKLHQKDKELDEKKAKSEELKSQAQMAKDHYDDVITEMHAYQLARETKIKATESVTSDEKLQVGEKANPKIDKNLTDDDIKDMAKMHRAEADEAKKKMEEYKDLANMVYTDSDRKNAEGIEKRIKEAEERIKKEQEAHGKAYNKVREARANGVSTAEAEKERELASQNIRNIQAEINAYQKQLDAINDKKKAQEEAINLANEERKKAGENIKEAKAYEHEDKRREKEKSPVTHGELDEIKTTINKKADAEKTGVLIDNVNKNIRKDMQDQLRTKADAKITDVNFSRTNNAVETLDKSKADAKATTTELDKHAKVIDKNTQNITKKADATKVAEKLNEVKKQKAKEFNFIKVDLGSDDDDKKNKKDKK